MAFKITYLFDDGNDHGWGESWYCTETVLNDALTAAQNVAPSRLALCGVGVYIKAIRVVDVLNPGASRYVQRPRPGKINANTPDQDMHDYSRNGYVIRVTAADTYKRVMWLRGVATFDIDYSNGGKERIAQGLLDNLALWLKAATANNFAINAIDKTGATNPIYNISAMGADAVAPNYVRFTTSVPNALFVGQYVRISGVSGQGLDIVQPWRPQTLNGVWAIAKILNDTDFCIRLPVAQLVGGATWPHLLMSVPKVRPVAKLATPALITSAQYIMYSSKKTGLPFGLQRGRRSAPRRR